MYPVKQSECHNHFNPWGACYMWMEPLWDLQKEGHYPPLRCEYCGRIFPGEKSVEKQSSDIDDVPFG